MLILTHYEYVNRIKEKHDTKINNPCIVVYWINYGTSLHIFVVKLVQK